MEENQKKEAAEKQEAEKPDTGKQDTEKQGTEKPETKKQATEEQATNKQDTEKKKRHIAGYVIGILAAVIVLGYGGTAVYYHTHFLQGTTINGVDCSNRNAAEVAAQLDDQAEKYSLSLIGRDQTGRAEELGKLQASDIDFCWTDTFQSVQELLQQQNELLWVKMLWSSDTYNLIQNASFDEELLKEKLSSFAALQRRNMIAPEDAHIGEYSEKTKCFEIVPETLGTQLDPDVVLACVEEAVYAGAEAVDLQEQGCYRMAERTAEDADLIAGCETANKWLQTNILYDWNGSQVIVDADVIQQWIHFEKEKPQLDEESVAAFVAEQAKTYDTYGKKRSFVTTQGVELTLPSGAFGWRTDREQETKDLIQSIRRGETAEKEPLYLSKGAQKGSNDIGSSYVEADLTNQHLYLYQNGNIVLETDFVSGNMSNGCFTPPGVFGLTYKTTNAVLRGDDYETPVNYWMPFNGNVGMHDATWRSSFGGTIYLTSGSHGCINLPLDMAGAIYQYVSTGFPVICYYY